MADLTTVAAVHSYRQEADGVNADNDELIAELVTRASAEACAYAGREFGKTVDAESRLFEYGGAGWVYLTPSDARSISQVRVGATADDLEIVDLASISQYPVGSDVTTHLGFGAYLTPGIAEVTGEWGWPAVPKPVEQAVIDIVCHWMDRRKVRTVGEFEDSGESRYGPVNLPTSARMILDRYKLRRVG